VKDFKSPKEDMLLCPERHTTAATTHHVCEAVMSDMIILFLQHVL